MKQYFITNAIPYVNDKPHVGHALEFVQTDAHARYKKLKGFDVLTLCGGDENAMKNVQAAEKAGREIQPFIDENTQLFLDLSKALNVHFDVWQRGSNTKTHFPSSQKLWELCDKNGDIYKKSYEGLYCVGCELFYTADELDENGECFEHPGKKLESVSEENYFFKLSKYTDQIRELIQSDKLKIVPEIRKNEMLAFLKEPLQDISISRSNERAKNWGVPVPNDPTQRMYVWFDALNIYQSGIGFGWDDEMYKKWWPAQVHVIGKGINRFHTIYWPAFLLSAGLELPKSVFVHGYFTVDGLKMSKTVGNVVDPLPIIKEYGIDALRYYFLREISAYGDGDFSVRRLIELYNADLANGLGNLVSRIAKLCEGLEGVKAGAIEPDFLPEVESAMEIFKFDEAVEAVWKRVRGLDKYLNENEPWRIKDDPQKKTEIMQHAVNELLTIGFNLQPFLPQTAEKMLKQFGGIEIKVQEPYFLRK